MNSLWIWRFFISWANTWRKITTISSTSMTSIDSKSIVVRSRWHRITKHHLSICVLCRLTRLDACIMRKYARCLILFLVLDGIWDILLWSFNSASNINSICRWLIVKAVTIMTISFRSIFYLLWGGNLLTIKEMVRSYQQKCVWDPRWCSCTCVHHVQNFEVCLLNVYYFFYVIVQCKCLSPSLESRLCNNYRFHI